MRWWSSAFCAAVEITALLVSNPPRQCAAPVHTITAFSDASLKGWGVVILQPSSINVLAGKWNEIEDIAVLEARAFLRTIQALPHQERRCRLRMMVDNTTVVGSIRRTRCANFVVNKIVGEALGLAREKGYVVETEYVKSIDNIADDPSRCGCNVNFKTSCAFQEGGEEEEKEAIDDQGEWSSVLDLNPFHWDPLYLQLKGPSVHGGMGSAWLPHDVRAHGWSQPEELGESTQWNRDVEVQVDQRVSVESLGKRYQMRGGRDRPHSNLGHPHRTLRDPERRGAVWAAQATAIARVGPEIAEIADTNSVKMVRLSKRASIRDIMKPEERGV